MANLQSWRLHKQPARPTDTANIRSTHIYDMDPSDATSSFTSPGADESKLPTRPRRGLQASFANYLGTHHRTASPSIRPEFEWANLNSTNGKDGVYRPDTELMCTTITQRVLANPSEDLPAQYNTFLLHMIEAYHQSQVDVQELQMKLAEKTDWSKTTVGEFHRAISLRSLENARMLQSMGILESNSDTLRSTMAGKEAITATPRIQSYIFQPPEISIVHEKIGLKQEQTGKTSSKPVKASRQCHKVLI